MKNEIERKVEAIFSPGTSVELTETPVRIMAAGSGEPERQLSEVLNPSYLSDAWADRHTEHSRLKTVGVSLEGLLNYYVDKDGITIEADDVLIETEQIEELRMELELVVCRQRELKEAE